MRFLFLANNLFGTFLTYKMVGILLKKRRVSINVCIALYLIYYAVNSAVYFLYGNDKITLVSNYICLYIIVFLIYDEYIWKKVLVPLLLAAVGFSTEEMFCYLMMGLFKTLDTLIVAILSNFVFCIILAIIHRHFREGVNDLYPKYINLLLIMLPITSIVLVIAFETKDNTELMAAGILGIIFLNIAVFFLYEQLVNAYQKEMEQYILNQKIRQYENQLELMRESGKRISAIRHDMKNHLIVLKRLIDDKNMMEAGIYLKQLEGVIETDREYAKTGNDAIDSILNYYVEEAKGLGAIIVLKLQVPAVLPITLLDISVILGNLLQNAVEALKKCEGEKKLNVILKMGKGTLRFIITNTYNGQPLIFREKCIKSTKPIAADHGHGLHNVRESVKKYDGEMECSIKDNKFEVNIFILTG